MIPVGTKVLYHDEHGDQVAWVTDYEAGRDAGDHHIAGFNSIKVKDAGQGAVFAVWSVVGTEHGAFGEA